MPQVKVLIDREGHVNMEGFGYVGKQCDAAMDPIARALGVNPDAMLKQYKPEALLEETNEQVFEG